MSFETATKAFKDAFAIERLDDRGDYGEDRYILTGTAEGVVLVVVYPVERRSYPDHFGAPRHGHTAAGVDVFGADHARWPQGEFGTWMEWPNTDTFGREGWHYQLRATIFSFPAML